MSARVRVVPFARDAASMVKALSFAPVIEVAPAPVSIFKVPVAAASAFVPKTAVLIPVSFNVSMVLTLSKSESAMPVSAVVKCTVSLLLPPITVAAAFKFVVSAN